MADYKVTDTELTAVANAIRSKGKTSALLEWPSGYISAINALPDPPPEIVSWSSGTDAQIVALIQAAHAGTIDLQQDAGWAVGDTRTINITGYTSSDSWIGTVSDQSLDIVISSFDDYNNCGCVLQFDFKDVIYKNYHMNSSGSNRGGYGASRMYSLYLPELVNNALPEWLKNNLVEFSALAANGGLYDYTAVVLVPNNKLALRSEVEIRGQSTYSRAGEGSIIAYYQDENNRIKKIHGEQNGQEYYTRSAYPNNDAWFTFITSGGGSYGQTASYGARIAPFGCL